MFLNRNCTWVWVVVVALCVAACYAVSHAAHAADSLFPGATKLSVPAQAAKLPAFDFTNLHGGTLKSSELKGKVLVIRFWATW